MTGCVMRLALVGFSSDTFVACMCGLMLGVVARGLVSNTWRFETFVACCCVVLACMCGLQGHNAISLGKGLVSHNR
jgi:hypothetical protein